MIDGEAADAPSAPRSEGSADDCCVSDDISRADCCVTDESFPVPLNEPEGSPRKDTDKPAARDSCTSEGSIGPPPVRADATELPEDALRCAGPDGVMEGGWSLTWRPGASDPRDPIE